jgi:CheY-like chemotaxis protein
MGDGLRAHERAGRPAYILVVDDDAPIREAFEEVLVDEGYAVRCAANGREALQILRDAPGEAQLILLDLMMPVMNGWDFRAEQQRDPALAGIPVVVVSADREVRTKIADLAIDHYLVKPVDLDHLLAVVRQASARP